ncbi:hypothetical protein Tco_0161481 [Tanacetum coccineum]
MRVLSAKSSKKKKGLGEMGSGRDEMRRTWGGGDEKKGESDGKVRVTGIRHNSSYPRNLEIELCNFISQETRVRMTAPASGGNGGKGEIMLGKGEGAGMEENYSGHKTENRGSANPKAEEEND